MLHVKFQDNRTSGSGEENFDGTGELITRWSILV